MHKLSLGVVLSLSFLTGCVSLERELEFSDAERLEIRFENAEASGAFHRVMRRAKVYYSEQKIQFLFPVYVRVKWTLHETEFYNALVRRTDVDRDGEITESEANATLLHLKEQEDED